MRSRPSAATIAMSLSVAVAATLAVQAQDWPQWRGPARDGAIAQFTEPAAWPAALPSSGAVVMAVNDAAPGSLPGHGALLFTPD